MQQRAAFEQQRADLALGQRLERRAKRAVPGDRDLRTSIFQPAPVVEAIRAGRRRHDDDRPGVACREHPRVCRRAQLAIEDHPRQRPFAMHGARGELRIVDQNRPDADADRVDFSAHDVRVPVGRRRREVRALARRGGEAAVEARGRFEDDERPSFAHQREERLIEPRGGGGADAGLDVDAVRPQIGEPAAVHGGIRILHRRHDAADPGVDDAADAGPVRPTWQHGSSVQYSVAPRARSPAISSACTSACGSPARRWKPCPTTTPSLDTTTAPTIGFGLVRPRPRAARNRARSM